MRSRRAGSSLRPFAAMFVACAIASPLAAQNNWRVVQSVKFGRFNTAVEVSSARTIRLVSAIDTSRLVSPEVELDTAAAWLKILGEADHPKRAQYTLGNAILLQPYAADSGKVGYLLTLADTVSNTRQVIMDRGGLGEFLCMLSNGVMAARVLTDDELRRPSAVALTTATLAKPYTPVYPRTAKLVGVSGAALMEFVVDTTGRAVKESIDCIDATFKDFSDAARAALMDMEFVPAMVDGHKISQIVQLPFEFKLSATMPITPFQTPVRRR